MATLEKEDFWGCELKKGSDEVKFNPEFEDSELSEVEHKLILSQACLGVKANGRSLVEVISLDYKGEENRHVIVSLKSGSNEMCPLNLSFSPPTTFKLIEGSGPVHLTGNHVQSLAEDQLDSEVSEEEEAPMLVDSKKNTKNKRPLPSSTPSGPLKKMKKDNKDEEEESSDDEEEETSKQPTLRKDKQETKKTTKGGKQDEKDSDEDEVEAEDDVTKDEDYDEEEEESEDEEGSEDESDEEESDDEDEEDSDEEDSDEEPSYDDESDEVTNSLTAKKASPKKRVTNGIASKKQDKTPTKTEQNNSPPKTRQQTSPAGKPTKDLESIKKAILKSPSLPKKFDKFKNFMRSSYKITDEKTQKDVWDHLQKNKK